MPPSPDILIVGAGPAGSATAVHLARAGHRVVLLDRARFPREKPCSEYLSPEAVRLLDRLGAVAELEAAGAVPLLGTRVFGPRGAALTGSFGQAPVSPWRATGLSVSRRILDHRLVVAAREAGAEVVEQTSVEELLYERGAVAGVLARHRAGRRQAVRARIVIGADGLRSLVARRLGRRRHGVPSRLAFVAHVAGVKGLDGHAEMHVSGRGYVGLNRIACPPGGPDAEIANVALVVPRSRAAVARGRVEQFLYKELERFPALAGRVPRGRLVREVLVTGPFAAWSGRVTADGALLVGDAADFFDPFTGEGITSALRGAELAAQTVSEALHGTSGILPARRLSGYVAARRAAFLGKWAVERLVGYGMYLPRLFDRAVGRLERRGLAHTFVGVTGDFVPAQAVLNPRFLARMIL
jgi:geranylgeranyl reductase family protein